ncbi:unnamed protein product [Chironomus riparius]|uniref:Reticulon-like protein n=1 Tax=Chironomus riparius TaxID=315576 RepID=A0A9N9RKP4_9DIPT|nr:unnamed protein product [Chironomus riparius]
MDNRENDLFGGDLTFNKKKIDDFSHLKDNTVDFLQSERSEKVDTTEKVKEAVVDDFLNFHDDVGDEIGDFSPNQFSPINPVLLPTIEMKEEVKQPEIDLNTTEDDYLNPYAMNKSLNETTNEKFISSEDLLTDFKDPIEIEKKKEIPEVPTFIEEPPQEIPVLIPPPEEPAKPEIVPEPVVVKKAPVEEPKPKAPEIAATIKSSITPSSSSNDTQIEAEKIFKSIGLDAWFKPDRLHPKLESLIYWRDVKKSGVVFGIGLSVLLAMSMFSLISVFAYLSLLTLVGTISFRIYKTVMSAIQKTSDGHPFKEVLDIDLTLSQDRAQQIAGVVVTHINAYIGELRRLFLVEDLVDSLKFGLLLWLMTYIGAIFNGMTVVILAYVAMFTLPKVYETNKQNIDQYLDLVRSKLAEITDKVKAAIPIGKKEETAKDK